jgi:polyphosphate kinase
MPIEVNKQLKAVFQLKKNDLFPGGRYHNFSDFFGFPNPTDVPELKDPPLPPLPHPRLEGVGSLIQTIQEQDQVLHFPYQRYDYIPQLILEAARHPEVSTIKITLYRVAAKSKVVEALLFALENKKEVVVFIEAKARFDEASNIFWGHELEERGAKVFYSYPEIKVHTKLLLIGFVPESTQGDIVYIGTGNFNEKTALLYGDHALLSARKCLAEDVKQVFGLLERKILLPKTEQLIVSPFQSRKEFSKLIEEEIALAQSGKPAYMILKMNSLEDQGLVEKLYHASQAGVEITLLVRGICILVPGIAGQSENIQVFSLIDRFLEHARVYIFGNGGIEKMYIASADWMTRNLDRRIEIIAPIQDPEIFQEIRDIINLQLQDNTKLRLITADLENPYREDLPSVAPVRAQSAIYDYLASKFETVRKGVPITEE